MLYLDELEELLPCLLVIEELLLPCDEEEDEDEDDVVDDMKDGVDRSVAAIPFKERYQRRSEGEGKSDKINSAGNQITW